MVGGKGREGLTVLAVGTVLGVVGWNSPCLLVAMESTLSRVRLVMVVYV